MKILICSIISFLLLNCSLESEQTLGQGYYLFGDGPNSVISIQEKGKSYAFNDVLLGEIVGYKLYGQFILVYRKASDEAKSYFTLQDSLWELQAKGDVFQYWIIDKQTNKLYGPLNDDSYNEKLIDLQLPERFKSETFIQ